jgi:hypothetical protein
MPADSILFLAIVVSALTLFTAALAFACNQTKDIL